MDKFSNILFVAEWVPGNSAAFAQAMVLAKNNQAKLTVLGAVDLLMVPGPTSYGPVEDLHDVKLAAQWDNLRELRKVAGDTSHCEFKVVAGRRFVEIIREVLVEKRDLVVKAIGLTHGGQSLFGSTDMKLLRQCPCPLWLIKSTELKDERQILAAVDYDPNDDAEDAMNRRILDVATSLALSEFAELHVVHAWRLAYEKTLRSGRTRYSGAEIDAMAEEVENHRNLWLQKLVDDHCERLGRELRDYLKPQTHLIKGRADHVVPALSEKLGAELLVMGTVGRVGVPGLFIGNTAETILRQINCSVLAVKPAGFVSPITLHQ